MAGDVPAIRMAYGATAKTSVVGQMSMSAGDASWTTPMMATGRDVSGRYYKDDLSVFLDDNCSSTTDKSKDLQSHSQTIMACFPVKNKKNRRPEKNTAEKSPSYFERTGRLGQIKQKNRILAWRS